MKRIFSSKREHVLVRVCVFLIVATLIAGTVGCVPVSRNLEIRDWYDLDAIRDNLAGHHTLMNDLDSTTAGYDEKAGSQLGIWTTSLPDVSPGKGMK
jgi:hypothetical protein